jgi:hypothetical protein
MLFEDVPRTDPTPARHAEDVFSFLSRVRGDGWQCVRVVLNEWFDHCPPSQQDQLRARLTAGDSRQALDAFWELYLHEVLLRQGFTVSEHPVMPGTGNHPDFFVEREGEAFYLEATIVHEASDERAFERRVAPVYDALNELDSPNFFLDIDVLTAGRTTPPVGRMRLELSEWLRSLDPDAWIPRGDAATFDQLPRLDWQRLDWGISFTALPIKPEARGKPDHRPVGMMSGHGGWVDDHLAMRDSLSRKAKRYGELATPYVIAICSLRGTTGEDEIRRALFGSASEHSEALREGRLPSGLRSDAHHGLWLDQTGPRHRGVSAVLAATHVTPWTIARFTPRLYHNPWAQHPFTTSLPFASTRLDLTSGSLIASPSPLTPSAMLGLSEDWPGCEWWANG